MKHIIFLLAITLIIFSSCKHKEDDPTPVSVPHNIDCTSYHVELTAKATGAYNVVISSSQDFNIGSSSSWTSLDPVYREFTKDFKTENYYTFINATVVSTITITSTSYLSNLKITNVNTKQIIYNQDNSNGFSYTFIVQ